MKSIFLFISLISSIFVFSQINVTCLKLTDTTKNIFYIGIDNPISVSIKNKLSGYQIEIEGAGGSLTKTGPGEYIVKVTSPETCQVLIKANGKQVYNKEFRAEMIADPVATLSGIRDTTVSRNRILLNPFLSIVIPHCYLQINFQVLSFTATFINNSDSIPTNVIGNLLSQEQIILVKEAESGSKIYFSNFRTLGPDDGDRHLRPFWIKIE
jgi:hypothetical protein